MTVRDINGRPHLAEIIITQAFTFSFLSMLIHTKLAVIGGVLGGGEVPR